LLKTAQLRVAGRFLLAGGSLALAGAFWPPYEQWYSPLPKALRVIAAHPIGWRCIHAGFLAGTCLVAIGLALFANALRGRDGGSSAVAAATAYGLGSVLWILDLAFRLSVTAWAADELVTQGSIPAVYTPLARQVSVLFGIFVALAGAAAAGAGWAFLRAELSPRWVGGGALVLGIAGALAAAVVGPWLLYVPIVFLGSAVATARGSDPVGSLAAGPV
jgi:hypothetical protein